MLYKGYSKAGFGLWWKCHICASAFFLVGPMHCSQDPQVFFSLKTTLKLGPTPLFTHLKIILLQYFQFSIVSGIHTDPKKPSFFEPKWRKFYSHVFHLVNLSWFPSKQQKFLTFFSEFTNIPKFWFGTNQLINGGDSKEEI